MEKIWEAMTPDGQDIYSFTEGGEIVHSGDNQVLAENMPAELFQADAALQNGDAEQMKAVLKEAGYKVRPQGQDEWE